MAVIGLQPVRIASTHNYGRPLGVFLLALVLLFLKSPDAILTPQFWAEDGPVFFASQFHHEWPRLLTPYAGYLHTVTRLIAWIASRFDVSHAPLIYNALAIVIDAACIAYVVVRMRFWFSPWAVLLSFFIVPTSGDIFGTATNVQWFMQFALAAACLTPSDSMRAMPRAVRIGGYVALALASLSGPFSILVAGLGIGAMLMSRLEAAPLGQSHIFGLSNILRAIGPVGCRLPKTNLLLALVCAGIQMSVVLTNEVGSPAKSFFLSPQLQASFGVSQLHSFYLYTVSHAFLAPHLAFLAVMIAVTTACLVHALLRPAVWNGIACLLLPLGAAQPLLAYFKEKSPFTLTSTSHYFFLLSVVCCWIVWNMLSMHFPRQRKPVFAFVAPVIVLCVSFHTEYFRRESLHDLNWPKYADQIHNGGVLEVVVPINPAPWHFKVNAK